MDKNSGFWLLDVTSSKKIYLPDISRNKKFFRTPIA